MTWAAAVVAGLVAGAAIGLLAVAMALVSRHGRRLDLVTALAGAAVAVVAARAGGVTQVERLINGLAVVPLAAALGGLIRLLVADRPRNATEVTRNVLVPASIAFAGQAMLTQWTGHRAFLPAARSGGVDVRGVLLVTWVEIGVVVAALACTALLVTVVHHGRTGRRWRTAEASPELLALVGVDPVRLAAGVAALVAAAGGLAGLAVASTGPVPAPGVADLGLRAGEALLVGGTRRPIAIVAAAALLEVARALGDRAHAGWGPAVAGLVALLGGAARLLIVARGRRYADADPVEELLR